MSGQLKINENIEITMIEVKIAWEAVKLAGGGAGVDGMTIKDVQEHLDPLLYKVWNRLRSGSYMAQPVRLVQIPKAKGGFRTLGVPNVLDRVAQTVIMNRLGYVLDRKFHEDSYAYRRGRGAVGKELEKMGRAAVAKCRDRCYKNEWVVEIDIKGFFDALDHDLMMVMLRKHIKDRKVLLYSERFLKAKGITKEGEVVVRERGTPQGGVVSPMLANLYLHEAFDSWMAKEFERIPFERYADDIVVHCATEKQARYIKNMIERRLKRYKLELHPEKTRIVYVGTRNDHDHRGHEVPRKFTFLSFDFKLRSRKGGGMVFTPAISTGAIKAARRTMQQDWFLRKRTWLNIEEIAEEVNHRIHGWYNYFHHHRKSELAKLASAIDDHLVQFLRRKFKNTTSRKVGWAHLMKIRAEKPDLFRHWCKI